MARTPLSGRRSVTSAAGSWKLAATGSWKLEADGSRARARLRRCALAPLRRSLLDIFLGDLAAGTGAGHRAQIDAGFGSQLLRDRGCLGRGREIGQHVALGDAHALAAGRDDAGRRQVDALLLGQLARPWATRRHGDRVTWRQGRAADPAIAASCGSVASCPRLSCPRPLAASAAPNFSSCAPMIATTVSTGIVWSTWYGPRCRVPAPSASTKKVVLSVSISRISWPFLTAAPSSASHWSSLTSSTVWPNLGI